MVSLFIKNGVILVAYGHDRFVILLGNKAIKFARFPVLRFILRIFIVNVFSKNKKKAFIERFGFDFLPSCYAYVMRGFYANKLESEYFKSNPDDLRVMPVTKVFLAGWIIIQIRGEKISLKEFQSECPLDKRFSEANKPHQFCKNPVNGRVVLVDYGDAVTCRLLKA